MPATLTRSHVQVILNRHGWFVREDGRTHMSDFARVSAQFGTPFAEAVVYVSGEWLDYDGSEPDVTAALEDAIDTFDELPALQPVASRCVAPNPAAWGKVGVA